MEENNSKFLTVEEMVKMENYQLQLKIENLKQEELKKDIIVKSLENQINLLKNEVIVKTINEIKRQLSENSKKVMSIKESNKNFNKQLAEKYELRDNWGYNPETGKIITQED